MVTQLQLLYEIPLFIFLVLSAYTIFQLKKAKAHLGKSPMADSYKWIMVAAIFFTLWGVDHIYHDLVTLPEHLRLFFHYIISHGFLLTAMVFIAIAARKTLEFAYSWKEKGTD